MLAIRGSITRALRYTGVGGDYFSPDVFETYGQINLLKAGIHFADALTTVSPTHARELFDPVGAWAWRLSSTIDLLILWHS